MAVKRGEISFEVCCPDCDVKQRVSPQDSIFDVSKLAVEVSFICSERACALDSLKRTSIAGKSTILDLKDQGIVSTSPDTISEFIDFVRKALRVVESEATLKKDPPTISNMIFAFTILISKAGTARTKPTEYLWCSAVVDALTTVDGIAEGFGDLPPGNPDRLNQMLEILGSQADTSAHANSFYLALVGRKPPTKHYSPQRTERRRGPRSCGVGVQATPKTFPAPILRANPPKPPEDTREIPGIPSSENLKPKAKPPMPGPGLLCETFRSPSVAA